MIDTILVYAFLIFILFVGIYKGRKIQSMKEFAIGQKNYATPVMAATIFATLIGGASTIGMTEKAFSIGLVFILASLGKPIGKLILARYIAPQMETFEHMITAGDMMEHFYGKPAKIITGVLGVLATTGYVGAQIIALSFMSQILMGIPYEVGLILGTSIIIIYAAFGGVQSITVTSIAQMIALLIAIPLICIIGFREIGGYSAFINAIPTDHKSLVVNPQISFYHLGLFIFLCIPFLDPSFIERLLMSRDRKQIVHSMVINAVALIPFFIAIGIIGLIALVLYPEIEANMALPKLINETIPSGLKGLVVIGIFCAIMSTGDAELNAASVMFVHDIIQPLKKNPLTDTQELKLTRTMTIFVGFAAILAAILYDNIFDLIIQSFAFWAPTILIPLIVGILGLRASPTVFILSVSAGITTFGLWDLLGKTYFNINGLIPGMLANGAVLCLLTYHQTHVKKL